MDQEQTPQERARKFVRWLVPNRRPTERQVLWAIRIAIVLGVLIAIGYTYDITLWDWAQLLIVPAVIAGGGIWFNQRQQERAIQIADQRAQDDALQAYLDQMSQLVADKERPLRRAQPSDNLSVLARARTLALLTRLDGKRKGSVLQFLYESVLISKAHPILDLRDADLRQANLKQAKLNSANLAYADLREANLQSADLQEADLSGTDLSEANLFSAKLQRANLSDARLSKADIRRVNVSWANLEGVIGVNNDDLDQHAFLLDGATMPDGQKYEDWKKVREIHEDNAQNNQNSGSS